MKYIEMLFNAVTELFKFFNKKAVKDDADTNKVETNPRPPKPRPAAPKPPDITQPKG